MAIVVPLFFLLVYGIIGFGFIFMAREDMQHAAQEALRAALVTPQDNTDQANVVGLARARLAPIFGSSNQYGSSSTATADDGTTSLTCNTDQTGSASGPLDICTNWPTTVAPGTAQAYPVCSTGSTGSGSITSSACMTIKITYHWSQAPVLPMIWPFTIFAPSTIHVQETGWVGST